MHSIAGPCAEQAGEEFADENWRDGSGAPQASQPRRRHIGAMSAIVGEAFDAATAPAPRKRLSEQELAVTMRVPSAKQVTPVNDYLWAGFGDRWERFTRDGSERVRHPLRRNRSLYRNAERRRNRVGSAPPPHDAQLCRPPGDCGEGRSHPRVRLAPMKDLSDPRRKRVRCGGNRLLIHDSARLDCLLEDSMRVLLNLLIAADDCTIVHSWLTLRRPDVQGIDVTDLRQELRRLFFEHRPIGKPEDKPSNRSRRTGSG
jgi:hypothetical protein